MHVELLCEQASLFFSTGELSYAERAAREAFLSGIDSQFVWGTCEAGHLLAKALIEQGRAEEARPVLLESLSVGRRIMHPRADQMQHLLDRLPGGM